MVNLSEKVVLVTGASSGIGKAAAIEFAQRGASVVLAARRQERLEEVCREISAFSDKCIYVRADVTVCDDVVRMFDEAVEKFGRVDILVNNAGCGLKKEIAEIEPSEWDKVIDVNLRSVFLCCREAIRRMTAADIEGHIITVCSIAGLYGVGGYSAYCAAKHGVTGFMRSCKWEVRKRGIKVSTIFPMRVDTEFFAGYAKKPAKKEMLSAKDLADDIVAVARQSLLDIVKVRYTNFCKRVGAFLFNR